LFGSPAQFDTRLEHTDAPYSIFRATIVASGSSWSRLRGMPTCLCAPTTASD